MITLRVSNHRGRRISQLVYPITLLVAVVPWSAHATVADLDLELVGSWPGFRRGEASSVTISDNYAYIAGGETGLHVLDVSNPADPRRVGGYDTGAWDVAVVGHYAYIAGGRWDGDDFSAAWIYRDALSIVDITDPARPQRVGGYDIGAHVRHVVVSGQFAYLAGGRWDETEQTYRDALTIIDISDPAQPLRVGTYAGGYVQGVAVSGQYAYVAGGRWDGAARAYRDAMTIIDIRDPAQPRPLAAYDTGGYFESVAVVGQYAYLPDGSAGIQVIDVSNPVSPQRVNVVKTDGDAQRLALSGKYASVIQWEWSEFGADESRIHLLDLADPASPQIVGRYTTSGSAEHVAVSGTYAYVLAARSAGIGGESYGSSTRLEVVDVSDPVNSQRVGQFDMGGYAWDLALWGDHAYVADGIGGLQVLDVSDPGMPERLGGLQISGWAHSVALAGKYACVVGARPDDRGSLDVIEISDPTNPRRVSSFATTWSKARVAISGDFAYLADGSAGLRVIDLSDPANPRQVGALDTVWFARGVAVSGQYAFVVAGFGFQALDVSDPVNPRLVGWYDRSGWANDLAVSGDYAYVAANSRWDEATKTFTEAGLQVINIRDPANPRRVGGYEGTRQAHRVGVSGSCAYLALDSGLMVVDIRDPARPGRVGSRSLPGARAVWVRGDKAYVAAGPAGLAILNSVQPGPRLESAPRLGASGFHLRLRAEPGQTVRLQRSSNLKIWADWKVVSGTGGFQGFADPNVDAEPARFYRATSP